MLTLWGACLSGLMHPARPQQRGRQQPPMYCQQQWSSTWRRSRAVKHWALPPIRLPPIRLPRRRHVQCGDQGSRPTVHGRMQMAALQQQGMAIVAAVLVEAAAAYEAPPLHRCKWHRLVF